jgi:aminopeptidase N
MTLAALRNVIGTDRMEVLLRRWVAEHRYGNTSGVAFRRLAEEVAERDLDAFFVQWLDQRDRPANTAANGLGGLAP